MVEISNKNNNKVVRVSVGGNSGNNPTIKPNGDYSSYYSELSKAWAIKMDGMVSKEDYSSKYYSTQAKANAETTENNLNSVISEHEQITNEITEARENISGDLSGALTDIATARDNGVAKVTETKTNSLSEIESAKTEAEQTITTGLNNFNTNAQAKSDSLQSQFDSAMTDIQNQQTKSVNAVKTAQSTAETSITELKTSAETSINDTKTSAENSITDIKNTAISDVQNQESTTEANIDKKVQEALNKIPDIDDKLNVSKMYKTGEISTDTTGYNQLVEMKHSTFDKSKFTVVGSPVITDDGVASGFSSSNYIQIPKVPELGKITESIRFTSSFVYNTISAEQSIWNKNLNFDFRLNGGSILLRTYDGSKANTFSILQSQHKVANGEQVFCDVVITPNLCRIKINGVEYTKEQVTDFSYLINVANKSFLIGMSNAFNFYFHTSIDLKSISITVDGKEVFSGNKTGIDTVKIGGETVEIPYTLSKTGSKIVDVAYRDKVQALYNQEGKADYYTIDETNQNFTLPMGEIYGMINSINNYQVNNTNSYGDNKYVGNTILNNLSWLRSVGQENPAGVHQDFYNWAVANIGQTFGAGLIKDSSATDITEYDLVVDQANQTFILPTLNGSENTMSAKYSAMSINGSPYNFTAPANGWLYMSGTAVSSNSEYITVYIDKAKTTPIIGRNPLLNASITYLVPVSKGQEVIIEYTASNISRCKFIYAKGNGNLYYYVGDTLQNADLINIARMQEQLVDKLNTPPRYVVEVSDKSLSPSWYIVYNDGWCEQGGYSSDKWTSGVNVTISLLKEFLNTEYFVILNQISGDQAANVTQRTTTSFTKSGNQGSDCWKASGYIKRRL